MSCPTLFIVKTKTGSHKVKFLLQFVSFFFTQFAINNCKNCSVLPYIIHVIAHKPYGIVYLYSILY